MDEIVEIGIHGHPGHGEGTGSCAVCGMEGVSRPGELWLPGATGMRETPVEACGPCLNARAGLSRLEGARGKLLRLVLFE